MVLTHSQKSIPEMVSQRFWRLLSQHPEILILSVQMETAVRMVTPLSGMRMVKSQIPVAPIL